MHLKRQKVPKSWPIKRKGTAYVVRPNSNMSQGLPILIILRDMLEIAQNRKEVKKIIHSRHVLLNNKPVKDEKEGVVLFDTMSLVPSKKSYRVELSEKGKFKMQEISEAEANNKIAKIVNKKVLKGKKIQLNLSDGRNFLSDIKCNPNDSVSINFKKKNIENCLPLKEKEQAIVFAGKHSGVKGIINKIDSSKKMVELIFGEKKINVLIKQLMVIK